MTVVTGSFYLDGFIGEQESEATWMDEKVQWWVQLVRTLSEVARKHPQSANSGMHKLLQQEWVFMQWVTPHIWDAFGPVEVALRDTFMPDLFQGVGERTLGQGVTQLPVKQAGLDLKDPTKMPPEKYMTSCVIIGYLVAAHRGEKDLR